MLSDEPFRVITMNEKTLFPELRLGSEIDKVTDNSSHVVFGRRLKAAEPDKISPLGANRVRAKQHAKLNPAFRCNSGGVYPKPLSPFLSINGARATERPSDSKRPPLACPQCVGLAAVDRTLDSDLHSEDARLQSL